MDTLSYFFPHLEAMHLYFLNEKAISKWSLFLKEIFATTGEDSLISELAAVSKGGKIENGRVTFPESLSIDLNSVK